LDLVPRIRTKATNEWLKRLPGYLGIANIRYTTSGKTDERSLRKGIQPVIAKKDNSKIAVSFNGNVVNTLQLKREIQGEFPGFEYECDADLLCYKLLIDHLKTGDLSEAVTRCMKEVDGAFSVAGITQNGEFFAFKDPYGIRPLCAGKDGKDGIFAFSSETVGFDINTINFEFEIEPGELVKVTKQGFEREKLVNSGKKAFCAFEFAYFARPDSIFGEKCIYEIREQFGRNLAEENQDVVQDADIVISIPETGDDAALGVHEATGLRWERASRRHRYVTERAFILLSRERKSTIDKKINFIGSRIRGKRVIITEDSIVRGDTTRVVVEKLRKFGAKKVYVFITFPRIISPCFYGINMATYSELIGSRYTDEEIAKIIGADSVRYQSLESFIKATGYRKDELCLGCLTRKYPTPMAQRIADEMWKRFQEGEKETRRLYEIPELVENAATK
jgi:amidophosphoribosyltransferase